MALGSGSASAADTGLTGYNVHFLHPAFDGNGLFMTHRSETLGLGQFHLELFNSGAKRLFVARPVGGTQKEILRYMVTGDLLMSAGLAPFLDLGVDVPLNYVWGKDFTTSNDVSFFGVGDIEVAAKLRLLKDESWWPGIAFIQNVSIPNGSEEKFVGDSGIGKGGSLAISKDYDAVRIAVNAGYQFIQKKIVLGQTIDDRFTYSGGFEIPLGDSSWSFMEETFGSIVTSNSNSLTSPIELMGGFRKNFTDGFQLTFGAGGKLRPAVDAQYRVVAGLGYNFGAASEGVRKAITRPPPETTEEPAAPAMPVTEREVPAAKAPKSSAGSLPTSSDEATLYFRHNAVKVFYGKNRQVIREFAERLKNDRSLKIRVRTHASSTGSPKYNQQLTVRRARNIKKILTRLHVSHPQIQLEPKGSSEQIGDYKTREGQRLNRRAVLTLQK